MTDRERRERTERVKEDREVKRERKDRERERERIEREKMAERRGRERERERERTERERKDMSRGLRDDITPALCQLQWLQVKLRVTNKLFLLMHAVYISRCQGNITNLVTQTYSLPGRDRLRSATGNRFVMSAIHHKIGDRAISHSNPVALNKLPPHITATIAS